MKTALTTLGLLAALASTAFPAVAQDDPNAFVRAHVQKIASGDSSLAADYRPDAFLWWVGGPLDGTYSGGSIGGVWTKFSAAQGTLTVDVSNVTVAANPKGQTVEADVLYHGAKGTLHIRQVVLLRQGHVQDEIWQIEP
jgi:hypothetical protein